MEPKLSVELGDIKLKNPIITCSGTFGSGKEYSRLYDISRLGAITTKSYSLKKRPGNMPPRIVEARCGLINSIGLQNEGIKSFIDTDLPFLKKNAVKVILSVFGEDHDEFIQLVDEIDHIKNDILALELNLSCPNIKEGGVTFCQTPDLVKDIVSEIKNKLQIPIIVKLSPNTDLSLESARKSKKSGADAISFINTIVATAVDIEKREFILGNKTGGLSGPAIKPIALAKVYQFCKEDILPVIGMGGISDYRDALEFMMLGAKAIGIGTINFIEPMSGDDILLGIRHYLKSNDIEDINDLIGVVLHGK